MSNTANSGQIDNVELRELLTWRITETAEWRSVKAEQYPYDFRNPDAVKRLVQLKASMQDVSIQSLNALEEAWESSSSLKRDEFHDPFNDTLSQRLRWIGFGYRPDTAQQFVDGLIESLNTQ